MDALSQILWRERELLELLSYRLEVAQLVLADGRTRHLARAAHDVEDVLGSVRSTGLLRAVAADQAAEALGLSPNPSLTALAEAVEDPWKAILREHRDALVALAGEIAALARADEELLTAGYRSVTLSLQLQQAAYQAALAGTADAVRPRLLELLR